MKRKSCSKPWRRRAGRSSSPRADFPAQAVENLACKIFSGEWNNAAQGKPVSIRTIRSKIHCACGLVSGLYDEFADLRRPAAERITEMADFQSEGILQE